VCFGAILDHFIPPLLGFVALGLVYSVPSQQIGWEERHRNDPFRVECIERKNL